MYKYICTDFKAGGEGVLDGSDLRGKNEIWQAWII